MGIERTLTRRRLHATSAFCIDDHFTIRIYSTDIFTPLEKEPPVAVFSDTNVGGISPALYYERW
jgi:hypothetical protein